MVMVKALGGQKTGLDFQTLDLIFSLKFPISLIMHRFQLLTTEKTMCHMPIFLMFSQCHVGANIFIFLTVAYSEGQNLYNVSSISSKSTITLDPKKL